MDNIIFTLHPLNKAAWNVLKDSRNANLLVQTDAHSNADAASLGKASALSLTIDRAPKRGRYYVMGRHYDADVVLTDPACSARHCLFSVSDKGVPILHEQSTNGTLINGKHCNNQIFDVQNGMQIEIRDAAFTIRVPWRGDLQQEYEYKVKRAKESRADTPLECLPPQPAPVDTTWVETLGPYTLTNTFIDSLKLANKEVGRTEIVRKGRSFFAAKRFNRKGIGQLELRAWQKIIDCKIEHPNIIHLEEVLQCQSGPVLVTELLPKGSLDEISCEQGVRKPYDNAASVMRQLFSALEHLHKLGIVHTTIQLKNLLVSTERPIHIKVTGFEYSSCGEALESSSISGCPAPEFWEKSYRGGVAPFIWEELLASRGYPKEKTRPFCGTPVDIWNAGVVCSQLTLGKAPCYLDTEKSIDERTANYIDLLLAVQSEDPTERSEAWAQKLGLSSRSMPPLLLNFLQKLLDPDPESRAKAEDCLLDSWLNQHSQHVIDNVKEPQVESVRKRRRLNFANTE
ncbi:MAG: hypothetical protein Q9213_001772 [Squamulea squamosa]